MRPRRNQAPRVFTPNLEKAPVNSTVRTEHRLEAYATLAFRTVERSPRAIPGAIAVHLE